MSDGIQKFMVAKLSFPTQHCSSPFISRQKKKKVFFIRNKKYNILVSSLFMLYNDAIECHILSQSGFMNDNRNERKVFFDDEGIVLEKCPQSLYCF